MRYIRQLFLSLSLSFVWRRLAQCSSRVSPWKCPRGHFGGWLTSSKSPLYRYTSCKTISFSLSFLQSDLPYNVFENARDSALPCTRFIRCLTQHREREREKESLYKTDHHPIAYIDPLCITSSSIIGLYPSYFARLFPFCTNVMCVGIIYCVYTSYKRAIQSALFDLSNFLQFFFLTIHFSKFIRKNVKLHFTSIATSIQTSFLKCITEKKNRTWNF